jgi:hypothetical protein
MIWLSFCPTDTPYAFYYPFGSTFTASLSFGEAVIPEGGLSNAAECYLQLQKIMGGATPNIDYTAFTKAAAYTGTTLIHDVASSASAFTLVWDLRTVPGDVTSSLSTRSGKEIVFNLTGLDKKGCEVTITAFAFGVLGLAGSMSDVLL